LLTIIISGHGAAAIFRIIGRDALWNQRIGKQSISPVMLRKLPCLRQYSRLPASLQPPLDTILFDFSDFGTADGCASQQRNSPAQDAQNGGYAGREPDRA
jgi:hypothetical protein